MNMVKEKIKIIIIWTFLIWSSIGCKNFLYRKVALKELTHSDSKFNYSYIPSEQIMAQGNLLYEGQKILFNEGHLFAFKNIKTKNIYIYSFRSKTWFKRITCDSLWKVIEVSEYFGSTD